MKIDNGKWIVGAKWLKEKRRGNEYYVFKLEELTKYKFAVASLGFSIASIVYLMALNYNLAQRYLSADGKTKALFGIIELTWVVYKFYLAPFLIFSLILWIVSFMKKEWKTLSIAAVVLSVVSILMMFVRIWIWMI